MNRRGFLKWLGLAPVAAAAVKLKPTLTPEEVAACERATGEQLVTPADLREYALTEAERRAFVMNPEPLRKPGRYDHILDTMRYSRAVDDRRRGPRILKGFNTAKD